MSILKFRTSVKIKMCFIFKFGHTKTQKVNFILIGKNFLPVLVIMFFDEQQLEKKQESRKTKL